MGTFPNEPLSPPVWSTDDFDALLRWSVEDMDASDINIIPEFPICHRVHGRWCHATANPVRLHDIVQFLESCSQNQGAMALLAHAKDLDFSYELIVGRGLRKRFRVNASACSCLAGLGVNLVFRSIPGSPPTVGGLGLEQELLDCVFHDAGLALVAGTMGSGKTTLLSAILRDIRENQPHRSIVTYEFPIEFDLVNIPGAMGPIVQTEIPTHLKSFDHAPVNAARRAVDVLLVGESRDRDTFRGICEASELGTATYTTVHTNSVAETVRRIVNKFRQEERSYVLTSLLGNLRVIIYQMLVPRADGQGRVAVREWLPISKTFRREVMGADLASMDQLFHEEIYRNGQPLIPYAEGLLREGLIDEDTFRSVQRRHAFEDPKAQRKHKYVQGVLNEAQLRAIIKEYARRENAPDDSINLDTLGAVIEEQAWEPAEADDVV